MFKCTICGSCSKPRDPQITVVKEIEHIDHPERRVYYKPKGGSPDHYYQDPGGVGTRIVSEERVLLSCSEKNCGSKSPFREQSIKT